MMADKPLTDLRHDNLTVSALNEAEIGIDKGEPEPDIVVFDLVKTFFAFVWIIFGDGNFPFQDIQIDQRFQIFCKAGGFGLQYC